MKTTTRLVLILLFLASACKKDRNEASFETLDGTWELRQIMGVQVPGIPGEYPPGNNNTLQFSGSSFERYDEGRRTVNGTYRIVDEKGEVNGKTVSQKIIFKTGDNEETEAFISRQGKTLTIYYGQLANDGAEMTYAKR
ncbi:MAG: hypothetical protein INR69_13890 [Mucilaginibacter polytrichastri]|nr:hypothetical protein [Mucilaginibacter polytrichastri]